MPNEQVEVMLEVDWDSDQPATSRVEFGLDEDRDRAVVASGEPATEHSALLLDLPPDTEVFWRAVTATDGEERSCEGSTSTGDLAWWLPDVELLSNELPDDTEGRYLLGITMDISKIGGQGLYILNRQGEWVWYHDIPPDISGPQVEWAADGSGDLVFSTYSNDHNEDLGVFQRVDLRGERQLVGALPGGHHFTWEHSDGTIAYLAVDVRDWYDAEQDETVSVVGDALVELLPDGTLRTVTSTWDWLDVRYTEMWNLNFYPGSKDWTHANGLHYYPESDTYLMSLGSAAVVAEIDRGSGEALRLFTGATAGFEGSMPVEPADDAFAHQHDPTWLDNGHMLMVSTELWTRAVEYEVDAEAGVLRQVWTHGEEDHQVAMALGNATRLSNGNTLYGTGSAGYVREATTDGEVVWELKVEPGLALGNVYPADDLGVDEE